MNLANRASRSLLMSASLLLMAPAAMAGSPGDIEDRIEALEAMIAELKNELAEQKAETDETLERLEAQPQAAPVQSGFKSGDTTLNWGGFIDLDTHVTEFSDGEVAGTSVVRDFYIPGATPVGGDGEDISTDMHAKASRFYITAKNDTGDHKIGGRIEWDFLVTPGGNERVSSSYVPRLRRAFVTVDNWLFGQEWTTFQNLSSIPESASFLTLSDGMVFNRQPMIRYTKGNFQVAVENTNATVTSGGARIVADDGIVPDVIARYNFKGDFGNISLSGLVRQLKYEVGTFNDETIGWGVSASGRVKVGAKDDIRFGVTGGEGVGRYVGLNATNAATLDVNGDLETIASVGGHIAYRHVLSNGHRFNFGYSGLFVDNDQVLVGDPLSSTQSGYVAYMWDIAPKVTVGAELLHGLRELESGADGTITRATFSTKYAF